MNVGRAAKCWAPVVVGLLLLGAGIACFNYTKPGTLQDHQAWASEHGRPAPSDTVLWGGAFSAVGSDSYSTALDSSVSGVAFELAWVDDASDELLAAGDAQQLARPAHLVSLLDLEVVAEDHDADGVFLEVEDQTSHAAWKFDHFTRHRRRQPVTAGNAVADFEHAADLAGLHLAAKVFNLLLDD